MDFDEYDYLERAVEQGGELELPLPAAPPPPKRKPDGVEEDPDGDGEGERGERRSKSLRRSHPDRGSGNGRHDDKPARGEREKDKSSRDKDKDSSRDKDRDKERERHRDRDRDRHRERSKDREREKDRDRERERERDRDREREKEKVSSREKDRAVSRDRREKETEHRDSLRDKETRHDSSRPSRDRKEKKEESIPKDPEADLERDQRTVFAYQICLKADERDVYDFFSKAGKVRDVRLIMDRSSRRSKGVGYIEFYDAMSVPMAIALSGQLLQGQPVMVKPSEAEKNLVQSTASTTGGANATIGPYSGGARRLYAGNLPSNITENQLRQVFEPFGSVELVQLPPDLETGLCKGFGFIQYARLEDARSAQQALDGVLELAGRVIKVSAMTDQTGIQDTLVGPGELDDDDGGGLSLTARSRALLMQKLDRSGTVTSTTAATLATNPSHGLLGEVVPSVSNIVSPLVSGISPAVLPGLAGIPNTALTAMEAIGAPTDCLLLKNMFNPKTETDPDFDLDIKDDVLQECSKFGVVKHIFVDKNSAGHVYLRFDSPSASLNAQRSLHGRWFAGMMITTQFWTPKAYEAKFPDGR